MYTLFFLKEDLFLSIYFTFYAKLTTKKNVSTALLPPRHGESSINYYPRQKDGIYFHSTAPININVGTLVHAARNVGPVSFPITHFAFAHN